MARSKETFEKDKTLGTTVKLPCVRCVGNTRHIVVASYDGEGEEEFDSGMFTIEWANSHQVIQCQGCEAVSFRHESYFSEDQYYHGDRDYSDGLTERLYPPRVKNLRETIEFFHAPPSLRRIYRETVSAYNGENHTLCAAGLRALVEGICAAEGVKSGPVVQQQKDGSEKIVRKQNLEGKISGLHASQVLTKKSAEALHAHRFLGNDAVHKLAVPSPEELMLALDIVEHMIDSLYEIPQKAGELRARKIGRSGNTA